MGGALGRGLAAALPPRTVVIAGRRHPACWAGARFLRLDLEEPGALAEEILRLRPRAVLLAAALSSLTGCAAEPERARRINHAAAEEGAAAAAEAGARAVFVSTDLVFDGRGACYPEDAAPCPTSVYGRTKAGGEEAVLAAGGAVARLPLLLGPGPAGRHGADHALLEALRRGERPALFTDEIRTPVAARLAAAGLVALLGRNARGVFHLAGREAVSRHELGLRICAQHGVEAAFDAARAADTPGACDRPRRLVLACERAQREAGWEAPDLQQSLAPWPPEGTVSGGPGGLQP